MSIRTAALTALLLLCPAVSHPTPLFDPGEEPPYAAALLMEAESGRVLFAHQPDLPRSPASTQKLLLELVVMDMVDQGKYSLEDSVLVSGRASRIGGSQVYLKQGEVFTLAELMEAVVIPSANDACVAVAEHIGGSVEGFVDLLNAHAARLGLQQTHCTNVHGLDDTPLDARNLTSARDLATVARRLVDHPHVLAWSSVRYKPFRGGEFMLYNTNGLLGRYPGLDGLKTGYTQRAGSCLVATAERDSMRLISVLLGAHGERVRERETARLLSWGFNTFSRVPVVRAGQPMGTVTLDWGLEPEVRALTRDSVVAVLSPEQERQIHRQLELPDERPAPVAAGDELGKLRVTLGDSLLAEVPLVADRTVDRMGIWDKLMSFF